MLHQVLVTLRKPFIKMVPIPTPSKVEGENALDQLGEVCQTFGLSHPLIVTDPMLVKLGLLELVTQQLSECGIGFSVFSKVTPDPDFELVREGVIQFHTEQCDGVIALGGGSPMDCGKAISASAKTGKDVAKLLGILKVRRRPYPVIAIPTTAGTGSETTVAAVISDPVSRTKPNITDPFIVPRAALLDPSLMIGLPASITAQTGIDALTHAIEAYISGYSNTYTRSLCVQAVKQIFESLPVAFHDGQNLNARAALAQASFDAGLAFTRSYVGYVHAVAHQLGAFYHVPHGLANAIVLPKVLRFTLHRNPTPIAQLADEVMGRQDGTDTERAIQFIESVESLLGQLYIPLTVPELLEQDIPALAKQAIAEAFGQYPVPAVMTQSQCEQLLLSLVER
jgi:alcohol dehydrogenase class IV